MGNAAGRPLINAVGRPRVVINGTCLDFLAESFMAGDPLQRRRLRGPQRPGVRRPRAMSSPNTTPYPGSNLFSLASGGAIYVRDPYGQVVDEQLNGGELAPLATRIGISSSPICRRTSASSASTSSATSSPWTANSSRPRKSTARSRP